jgi:CobQ-like glutamine amidotransferase family enzyme
VIRVFSFRPEHFNLNGDQGNLEALRHFTKTDFTSSGIEDADLVLFGDASRAAMRHFSDELESQIPELSARLAAGSPTLLVGSCYEFFSGKVAGLPALSVAERVSEFRQASAQGITVKGYRNSEVASADLFISGHFVGTTLFGPVLAKNPTLLEHLAKGLGLEVSLSDEQLRWIAQL